MAAPGGRGRAPRSSSAPLNEDSMSDERWTIVDRLFDAALEREPHERAAFLDEACADDEALRREVESLLAHDAALPAGFLARPALELVGRPAESRDPSLMGRQLGPYAHLTRCWASAAWARSIARATRSSGATSRSRSCRASSRPIPSGAPASTAKRGCWPH